MPCMLKNGISVKRLDKVHSVSSSDCLNDARLLNWNDESLDYNASGIFRYGRDPEVNELPSAAVQYFCRS